MNSSENESNGDSKFRNTLRVLSPLHRAGRQVSIYMESRLADVGVSAPDGHLLGYLAAYGPCRVAELSRVFGVKGPTMTGTLDRLESKGWIERALNPNDRRSFLVSVTAEGRRRADHVHVRVAELDRAIVAQVTADELRAFERVLDAIETQTGVVVRAAAQDSSTT